MKNLTILLFLVLFYINNTYALLDGGEEEKEEEILSSNDKFEKIVMSSSLPPNILPTNIVTITKNALSSESTPSIIKSTKSIINTKSINKTTKTKLTKGFPFIVTLGYPSSSTTNFATITTVLPSSVEDVYIPCSSVDTTKSSMEPTPSPYVCDNNMNCYTLYDNFNYTSNNQDNYNCNLYTRKGSDSLPTESVEVKDICTPTLYKYTEIYENGRNYGFTTITNEDNPDIDTVIIDNVTPILHWTVTDTTKTVCSTSTTSPNTWSTTTIPETPSLYPTPDLNVQKHNNFYFKGYFSDEFVPIPMSIPESVDKYSVDCEIHMKEIPRPVITQTSTTTTTTRSKSVKSIPQQQHIYRGVISPVNYPRYRADIDEYCENDNTCFKLHTMYTTTYQSNYINSVSCAIYTHKTNEPIYSSAVRTSLCRPTTFHYLTESKISLTKYVTMYDNYSNNNRRETILRSLTKFTTVSVYCQTDDDNTIITASITTEPSKTTSSISSSIESTTQSTTTTTTKTISDIKSTKCIPVIKTVTEKEKVTIKETLTVTVTAVNDKPSHKKCAKKWAQCGGKNYNGPNCCETGSTCHKVSDYYSQCI